LELGDRVEVIDRTSPYFGKRGGVMDSECPRLIMIDLGSKPTGSEVKVYCQVKLEDTGTAVEFALNHLRKIQ
jgi:hypothetical protein